MLKLPRPIAHLFQFDRVGWIIAILIGGWWETIDHHHFPLSYLAIFLWSLLGVGAWLRSKTLEHQRPKSRRLKNSPQMLRHFRVWQWVGSNAIVLVGVFAACITHSEQRIFVLSQFNGVLYPANDPDPATRCGELPSSALRFDFGGTTIVEKANYASIVTRENIDPSKNKVLLGVNRLPDGSVSLIAHITGPDEKVIVDIDQNHFFINRNEILDSLSPPRTDLSTIFLRDPYGNALKIRFANKRWIIFSGKVYFRDKEYIETTDNGLNIEPSHNRLGLRCIILANDDRAGFFGSY
jgi:hypothetical protein